MARFLLHDFRNLWRKGCTAFLALSWFSGLVFGSFLAVSADNSFASLMRAASERRVSIVGLLVVTLLPFLFSAFAVYLSQPRLLLPVAFCKAASVSQVALGIGASYGSAGWLMRFLLMFSDLCVVPLLFFYWLRYISGERRFGLSPVLLFLAAVMMIVSVDIRFVSPVLANL